MELIVIAVIIFFAWKKRYESSSFYKQTKTQIVDLFLDKRKKFQYRTYLYIKRHDRGAKVLVNVRNELSMEVIDIVYITKSGIYLLNYDEHDKEIFGDFISDRWLQKNSGFLTKSTFSFF